MRKKRFLRATLLAATLVAAGYGGMKAYDYAYGKSVNSDDAMLIANVEALTWDEEPFALRWVKVYTTILHIDYVEKTYFDDEGNEHTIIEEVRSYETKISCEINENGPLLYCIPA